MSYAKFHAKPTTIDGIRFASKMESERYTTLKWLDSVGDIMSLRCQPRYDLSVGGIKICTYVADFEYVDTKTLAIVIEDVKGMKTPVYRIKKKLFEVLYAPYRIVEITSGVKRGRTSSTSAKPPKLASRRPSGTRGSVRG